MKKFTCQGLLILISMCIFSGCTKYWYQEGKTIDECKKERLACFEELKDYSSDWRDMGQYEFEFMTNCMKEKGYRLFREDKLPLRVKREDPDRWQGHARFKGVAGIPDEEK